MSICRSVRLLFWAVLILLLPVSGCTEDKCGKVSCKNNGVCVDGRCSCPYGYEGDNCEALWLNKFTATWHASDSSRFDTAARLYDFTITNFRSLDTLLIRNFIGSMDTVIAVRKAYNKLTLLERTIDSVTVMKGGEATIDSRQTTVTGLYSFKQKDQERNVYFTWTK